MGYVIVLFALAFMVQQINVDLQLAEWVIGVTEPVMSGALLPAIVFLVCGVYAYATGAFWDLAAVITPVVLPLAIAMGVDPVLAGTAVFSGAALGSTTCLYGDGIHPCIEVGWCASAHTYDLDPALRRCSGSAELHRLPHRRVRHDLIWFDR